MYKMSVSIDGQLIGQGAQVQGRNTKSARAQLAVAKQEAMAILATLVEEEFAKMLYDTPQYSGNFVANMALQAGDRMGRKGGEYFFPKKIKRSEAFIRGHLPAVQRAWEENKGFKARFVSSLTRGAGLFPAVTVYNRIENAEFLESLEGVDLREDNRPGAHPIEKMERALQKRFSERLVANSPHWDLLVMKSVL